MSEVAGVPPEMVTVVFDEIDPARQTRAGVFWSDAMKKKKETGGQGQETGGQGEEGVTGQEGVTGEEEAGGPAKPRAARA